MKIAFILCMIAIAIMDCVAFAVTPNPDPLMLQFFEDGKGGRLKDGRGGFLLAIPVVQSDNDNLLTILRIVGDPNTTGRMLSLSAHVPEDDRLGVLIMAYAVAGGQEITLTEIFGNNARIASCPTVAPEVVGKCNYRWPVASMIAGNNELRMEYVRKSDGLRFQTYGRIGRP